MIQSHLETHTHIATKRLKSSPGIADSSSRIGLTLVELLVVVGVVSVLAAVVLPSVKTVLTDRKSSQAAIVVRNFIDAARARAIGKNRSVAVVLERLSSRAQWDPTANGGSGGYVSETASGSVIAPDTNWVPYNACIRLSLAEEPMPVSEAMLSAPVTITARSPGDGLSPSIPNPGGYTGQDQLIDADQIAGWPEVRIFRVTSSPSVDLPRLLGEYLVNGAEISFGSSKRRFTIVSPLNPNTHRQHFAPAPGGDGSIWFSVMNERGFEGRGERAMEPYEEIAAGTSYTSFKIYSRPKPVFSEMVQLPRGICIDLSLSGFAGMRRGSSSVPADKQTLIDPSVAGSLADYRVRFASDWIGNSMTPLLPQQLRPIYIVFSPEGNLSHVWANDRNSTGGNASYTGNLVRIDAVQDIFLHIGKIDKVAMPLDPSPQILARNRYGFEAALAAGTPQNLTDLNSYIVRLSPKSGSITAAPAVGIDTQIGILGLNLSELNFGDLIELSRRGTYNSNVTSQ